MDLLETIQYLIDSKLVDEEDIKWKNEVLINGYLIRKPKEKTFINGRIVMDFYILQVHQDGRYSFFPCQCYSIKAQDKLRAANSVSLVNLQGTLLYNKNREYVLQVYMCEITHSFPDLPLPAYYKENNNEQK